MRVKKDYFVLTFSTTTSAMAMEKQCTLLHIPGRLIPVPREITAGCGLAWRIPFSDYQENQLKIHDLNIPFEQIVQMKL